MPLYWNKCFTHLTLYDCVIEMPRVVHVVFVAQVVVCMWIYPVLTPPPLPRPLPSGNTWEVQFYVDKYSCMFLLER